ncbi:cyclase family protein [Sphingomicrobium nitratireducens]|uniref:cyclase family protein n=1 Tax=Sphingomicrobium nitratireducens TaxID=2964666 RepID=UPI0022408122|nr:cyclase family protein [Sphingomicrobium nitratireducens]
MHRAAILAASLTLAACASGPPADPFAAGRWVDLTHSLGDDTLFWPTADPFRHEPVSVGRTPGGWYYSAYNVETSEHGGTHMDAPIHFHEGGITADRVPLERLVGPAAVIDVREASRDPDYRFSTADIARWEKKHGRLHPGTIVLFDTGRASLWPDAVRYLGTAERGEAAVAKLHFPGLSEDVAHLLVTRGVAAIGLDTPSLDYGQSKDFIAHRILSAAGIPGFENVGDMSALPARGATIVALPAKIAEGSGAPLRIIAFVPR